MTVRPLVARYFQLSLLERHRRLRVFALIALSLLAIDTILTLRASADQPISDNCGFAGYGPNEPAGYQHFTAPDCSQALPETVSDVAPWANPALTITASGGRFSYWAGWTYATTTYSGQNIPCGNQSITVTFSRPVSSVRVQPGTFGGGTGYRSNSITVSDNVGNSVVITKAPAAADFPLTALTAPFPGPGITSLVLTANDGLAFTLGVVGVLAPENDCYAVKSLDMLAINSPLDTNPNASGGQRIFPDKLTASDTIDRKRVRIKAFTASGANKTIFFRSFDLDDPSSAGSPIDPNDTNGPTGNDNRGTPALGIMSAVGASGTSNVVSAVTDINGVAQADLLVSIQPGDNFLVAASADQGYVNAVVVDGLNLKEGAAYGSATLPTYRAQISPMLTVWRRLNIEVDSMGNVAGNQATGRTSSVTPNTGLNQTVIAASTSLEANRFQNGRIILNNVGTYPVIANATNTITVQGIINSVPRNTNYTVYDDDDFNGNDSAALRGDVGENVEPIQPLNMFDTTFQLVQDSDNPTLNVFAPAYIRPSYAWASGAGYNTSSVSFKLNIADTGTAIDSQLNLGRNSANNESSNFWVAYLQIGYQHEADEDNDPNGEAGGATTGVGGSWTGGIDAYAGPGSIPRGTDGALIYIEVQRDTELNNGFVRLIRTVAHELGHQFALKGDDAGNSFGIMSYGNDLQFVPAHLNILRWRISSPGKP